MSDNETRTCPCKCCVWKPSKPMDRPDPSWRWGEWLSWDTKRTRISLGHRGYCNECGALVEADGTTSPSYAELTDAYERLLEAHAGTPAACGLDAATWADAARAEARPSC